MRKGDPAYGEMSGSGRRRSSKWDLKEESHIQLDNIHEKGWTGKGPLPIHEKESRGWLSPEAASGNRHKWTVMEPISGKRGSHRDDSFDEDLNRNSKAMKTWEEEGYGTRMSPGLDEWRQDNHRNSPRNEWKHSKRSRSQSRSRSRSRSADHGLGRESGSYERSRSRSRSSSRSGISSQTCKDFVAGRCRKANHCQFPHHGTEGFADDWERRSKTSTIKYSTPHDSREYSTGSARSTDCCSDFLKGSCRRGASCRFSHHGVFHSAGKGSYNEVTRERNDRKYRDASPDRHGDHEIRRRADVPCKFFAAGNCRNGKHCRFSHQVQAHASSGRSRDGWVLHDHVSDDTEKVWSGPKWNSTSTSDSGKLSDNKNGMFDASDQKGMLWSVDDRRGPCLEADKSLSESLINSKIVKNEKMTLPWKTGNTGDESGSQHRAGENWLDNTGMSPEWNYEVRLSSHIEKPERSALISGNPSISQDASSQVQNASAIMPLLMNEASAKPRDYNLRDVSSSALPHDNKSLIGKDSSSHGSISSNVISNIMAVPSFNHSSTNLSSLPQTAANMSGHSEATIPTSIGRGIINPQNQTQLQEGKVFNKPDSGELNTSRVNSGGPITLNIVSSEQLTQLTNISASLAQLLANGQQLPQIYVAHTSHANNGTKTSSLTDGEGAVKADSAATMQTNAIAMKLHQYDTACDHIVPDKHSDSSNKKPSGLSPNLIALKKGLDGKLETSSKSLSPSSVAGATDYNKVCSLKEPNDTNCQPHQLEPSVILKELEENNNPAIDESGKVEDVMAQETDLLENTDENGKIGEGKRNKDNKGIRAFKFALVEFVKDLLKPAWKEGQMSKDAYKNIVKKVVDKVTGTMQGASIPQTAEKIQQYLSFSKPKLTKLVQAYVEKLPRGK